MRNFTGTRDGRCGLPRLALLLLAGILFLSGCAAEVGTFVRLKQGYPPKDKKSPVEVFETGLPTRPFERVAILDAHCEAQSFMVPNLKNDGLPKLMEQARAAGCDAIIEIREKAVPANWTLETRVKSFTAVGIAYK
jgi:hypothetical protein